MCPAYLQGLALTERCDVAFFQAQNLRALEGLARIAAEEGDKAQARTYYGQILAAEPSNHRCLAELGCLASEEARWGAAIDYFNQAVELDGSIAMYR